MIIELVKESISIPVNVIIRPRGGDFFYNENEVETSCWIDTRCV